MTRLLTMADLPASTVPESSMRWGISRDSAFAREAETGSGVATSPALCPPPQAVSASAPATVRVTRETVFREVMRASVLF